MNIPVIFRRIGVVGMVPEGQPHVLTLRRGVDRITLASFLGVEGTDACKLTMSFLTGQPRLAGAFLGVGEGFWFFIGLELNETKDVLIFPYAEYQTSDS